MRPSGRTAQELLPLTFTRHYTKSAEGAVLVEFVETRVLCTAIVERGVSSISQGPQ